MAISSIKNKDWKQTLCLLKTVFRPSPAEGIPEGIIGLGGKLNLIEEIYQKLQKMEYLEEMHESITFFNKNFEKMKEMMLKLILSE